MIAGVVFKVVKEKELKKQTIRVAVPGPFMQGLDYLIESDSDLIGKRVMVPLRNREVVGVVVSILEQDESRKLKPAIEVLDEEPVFNDDMMKLMQWVSDYYHYPIGDCYHTAMPKQLCKGKPFVAKKKKDAKLKKAKSTALELTDEQAVVLDALSQQLDKFSVSLLEGVTGSGKTEVYLQLVDAVLAKGKQALLLVPEIGLTPQTFQRFCDRFPDNNVVPLHSGLSDGKKTTAWHQVFTGDAQILVGTRSSLFAPFKNLGIIIVDEEHDLSFKQQSLLRYNARDIAIKRAHDLDIPCLLGSATPSLESLHHALNAKYQHFKLSSRPGAAVMPNYHLIDMRGKKLTGGLSEPMIDQIRHHIEQKSQVLLFVNRRGYAPVLMCHECGFTANCTRCDCFLTLHQHPAHLCCHHCGRTARIPTVCPECEQAGSMADVGAGTEKIETHLQALFPDEKVVRIDRGNTSRKGELEALLAEIHSGDSRLLVGTQMIAKGHHFEGVTMVGVINIDDGLASADFRSIERVGQLLTQVSGRAGRGGEIGEVYIQTHQPDNPQLQVLLREGYHTFARELVAERETAGWPPYSYLALLHAEAKSQHESKQFLEHCRDQLARLGLDDVMALGPVPALLQKKAGFYRFQLLLQSSQRGPLHQALSYLRRLLDAQKTSRVRWNMDIDPLELL